MEEFTYIDGYYTLQEKSKRPVQESPYGWLVGLLMVGHCHKVVEQVSHTGFDSLQ